MLSFLIISDNKSRPDNQESIPSERRYTAWERVRRSEAIKIVLFHLEVRQGYEWQDAFHVIEDLCPDWTGDEVEEIIKEGIIEKVLKEAEKTLANRGVVKNVRYVPPDDF